MSIFSFSSSAKIGNQFRGGRLVEKTKAYLPTGTGVHCHIGIYLEDDVLVFIKEEDAEGRHLLRNTAGLWDAWDHPDRPNDALDGRMV